MVASPPSPQDVMWLLERAGLEPTPAQRKEITEASARLDVLVERLRAFDLKPGDEPLPTYRPVLARGR